MERRECEAFIALENRVEELMEGMDQIQELLAAIHKLVVKMQRLVMLNTASLHVETRCTFSQFILFTRHGGVC